MLVMVANNTGMDAGILVGRYPGRVGHLYSPGRNPEPRKAVPFALDNGAYSAYAKGIPFNFDAFQKHVKSFAYGRQKPLWIAVPDVVTKAAETFQLWDEWEPKLREYGLPLAMCVQDGMQWWDIEARKPDVVFVGGSVEWKWKVLPKMADKFARVHVGKVNSPDKLWVCHEFGVESCDGTGWFRGDKNQIDGLEAYLRESSKGGRKQATLEPDHGNIFHLSQLEIARIAGPDEER